MSKDTKPKPFASNGQPIAWNKVSNGLFPSDLYIETKTDKRTKRCRVVVSGYTKQHEEVSRWAGTDIFPQKSHTISPVGKCVVDLSEDEIATHTLRCNTLKVGGARTLARLALNNPTSMANFRQPMKTMRDGYVIWQNSPFSCNITVPPDVLARGKDEKNRIRFLVRTDSGSWNVAICQKMPARTEVGTSDSMSGDVRLLSFMSSAEEKITEIAVVLVPIQEIVFTGIATKPNESKTGAKP